MVMGVVVGEVYTPHCFYLIYNQAKLREVMEQLR